MINARAATVRTAFEAVPEWRLESLGSYFAYVRHPFEQPAAAVAERLASEFGAVCLPGPAFGPGQEQHLRVAFANTDQEGLGALATRLGQMMHGGSVA